MCQSVKASSSREPNASGGNSKNKSNGGGLMIPPSLLIFIILGLAWLLAFCSRLFAVIRFESIIHEFDPW